MSKILFFFKNQKEGIKSYNWSKKNVQQKHAPFYESTCSLDELDEKPNRSKFQNLKILKEKATKQKTHF
jgi:hypothetical protein